jgi:hypothetical protein
MVTSFEGAGACSGAASGTLITVTGSGGGSGTTAGGCCNSTWIDAVIACHAGSSDTVGRALASNAMSATWRSVDASTDTPSGRSLAGGASNRAWSMVAVLT